MWNVTKIMAAIDRLGISDNTAEVVSTLRTAALADDQGAGLNQALGQLEQSGQTAAGASLVSP